MGAPIAAIVLGFIELLFGRKLFWIFVAIGGFLIGWVLVPEIVPDMATWLRIVIGLVAGVVFALLSIPFTRVMVAVAGFFIFGGALVMTVRVLGPDIASGSAGYWAAFIVGGLIGAALLFIALDWALIVLTSLAGAGAVSRGIVNLAPDQAVWVQVVIFVILAVLGIAVQARVFASESARRSIRTRRR